ncbi:methyltransferase, FkbM family [Caminicella sporogenes DSM 14501]|uniref:Methyltransferase, FkbM family n=1 Tax=Caminicella sporogenes DSM 14501 TaxID=1121266 RepID=A0A1M6Q391_9FIRM|nr:FkbM family methyltransferase [Caminicella sporogenes]RKD23557.1 hypothetical protein BET04_03940 [Caminicella sporogenes]SHK14618.1 methyltransferase, FkbM family [Caminicella sporogenes DSM 14501]
MDNISEFRSNLIKNDLYNESAKKYVDKIKNTGNIVIWGCASTGQYVYDFLEKFGLVDKIKYFADNDRKKWGSKMNGLLILSPEEVVKKYNDKSISSIIVASQHLSDIRKQLLSLGIEDHAIDVRGFSLAKDYLDFRNESPFEIINSHIEQYEKVYSYLSDEHSKKVYLGILNSKISLDNKYMKGIASPAKEQYFDKELIKISEEEVFCDCGSFNGDTLETFISLSGGRYKKYIAIEADKEIYNELNKKVVAKGISKNVQTYNVACWDEKTILKFQPLQDSGHISENGEVFVCADTLDNILQNEEVTFLKMDIEGAEERALKGASAVIKKYKPVLAICLYHSLEDYYKLPLLIKEMNDEYSLFIRNYTDMLDVETVCYAIPKDRL